MSELNLAGLEEEVRSCRSCRLCETRTHVVFGVGVADAEVFFIGEGPGRNEDEQGEPFVGRSGQHPVQELAAVDLDRKRNIYIGNMVKCRPPENRDPQPDEVAACMGYLRKQVALIRPKILVCLGRVAAQQIISPDFKVTKQHGAFIQRGDFTMMGTFHPSALLRNPNQKPDAMEDFLKLREKIREICTHTYP